MQKRFRLWMADWRDASGKRKRRGFTTRKSAANYAAKRRAEAETKKDQGGKAARGRSSTRTRTLTQKMTSAAVSRTNARRRSATSHRGK